MLEYERTGVSEDIDTNKLGGLRECVICHYWYFLKMNFGFHPKVYDGCYDLTQKSMDFNDVAISTNRTNN